MNLTCAQAQQETARIGSFNPCVAVSLAPTVAVPKARLMMGTWSAEGPGDQIKPRLVWMKTYEHPLPSSKQRRSIFGCFQLTDLAKVTSLLSSQDEKVVLAWDVLVTTL